MELTSLFYRTHQVGLVNQVMTKVLFNCRQVCDLFIIPPPLLPSHSFLRLSFFLYLLPFLSLPFPQFSSTFLLTSSLHHCSPYHIHNVHILSSPPLTLPSSFPTAFSLKNPRPPFQPALSTSLLPVPCPLTSSSSTQDHIKYLCCWNRGRLLKHTHYCQPFC